MLTRPMSPMANARKVETADLRSRSQHLRESSRDLRRRSSVWKRRIAEIVAACEADRTTAPEPGQPYLLRLLSAEADLEGAIAECRAALNEVRRELRWRQAATGPVVH